MNVVLSQSYKHAVLDHLGLMAFSHPVPDLAPALEARRPVADPGDYLKTANWVVYIGQLTGAPRVSENVYAQALYVAMRMDGMTHALAEMLALQMPPMSNTDREFMEGHCNGNQFEGTPWIGDYYAREARAAGVDITGRVYVPGLATFPGDPKAWVSGRGDVERVATERGMSVQGSVNVKARDLGPPPEDVTVAEDLVEARMGEMVEANPDMARPERAADLYHAARDSIKPHWGE